MKPFDPNEPPCALPLTRPDGQAIGPAMRVLSAVLLAGLGWLLLVPGFDMNRSVTLLPRDCSALRRAWSCHLENLLVAMIPAGWAGPVVTLTRLGFAALLLWLIVGLLRPLFKRRR